MSKRIVWQNPDGSVAVTVCVEEATDEEVAAEMERVRAMQFPTSVAHIVPPEEVPADREFRNAWEWQPGKGIGPNLARAKVIQEERVKEQFREERAKIRQELDDAELEGDSARVAQLNAELNSHKGRMQTALQNVRGAADIAQLRAAKPARR